MILILYIKNKHRNFVHDRGIAHLDVIPNYIYVKEKFFIGFRDFGCATLQSLLSAYHMKSCDSCDSCDKPKQLSRLLYLSILSN